MGVNDEESGLLSNRFDDAGVKYHEFFEELSDYHEKTNSLIRTVDNEAEPPPKEYILAFLFFWCWPFFRQWYEGRPARDPTQILYYQQAYHDFKSGDLTINTFSSVPLNYCKSNFQKSLKSLIGLTIQLALTITISVSMFGGSKSDENVWHDITNTTAQVVVVTISSSVLLLFAVRDQFRGTLVSSRFFSWHNEIYGSFWFLFLVEAWSNFGLSIYLFFLNILVVQTSEDAVNAVLNSVAIFFIAQVDEYLVPDYRSDESKDNQFAVELFHHYCHQNKEAGVNFKEIEDHYTK